MTDDIEFFLGLTYFRGNFLLKFYKTLKSVESSRNRGSNIRFRNNLGASLDHVDSIGCSGHYHVKIAGSSLSIRRIDHQFAIHAANTNTGHRAIEGDVGN